MSAKLPAPRRIVVFTAELSFSVRKGIVAIDDAKAGLQWLIVLHAPRRTARLLLRNQWRNLRRNGWRWVPYELADLWRRARQRAPGPTPALGPGAEFTFDALCRRPNVRLTRVADIHAPATLDTVRAFAPDLGLSLAAPILRRALFSIAAHGTVNLHKGKLPEFRGMPPAFWELWREQSSVGCTVHKVDDELDTGALVAERTLPRAAHSTLRGLQLQLDEIGIELMADAVQDLLADRAVLRPQSAVAASTNRKPTLLQEAALRRKLTPHVALADRPKRLLKEAYAEAAFALHKAGFLRLLTPRITVLLYHRVSDEVRDNLTVGVAQFERQMALLVRHFTVLAIEDVLKTHLVPRSSRPLVAVTFDDGYLDNYQQAAPILRRHGVPAAFFVSTGIVASENRFAHDIRRGNPLIPVMNWDQIRTLRRWGFTIGSHTVHHIDCAAEPEVIVREELARSRDDLRREVDVASPIFAYPYGGKRHMTPERLGLVRELGYAGCLSAYGGVNVGSVDHFNVRRRSINHEFSDRAFLLESLGLRDA